MPGRYAKFPVEIHKKTKIRPDVLPTTLAPYENANKYRRENVLDTTWLRRDVFTRRVSARVMHWCKNTFVFYVRSLDYAAKNFVRFYARDMRLKGQEGAPAKETYGVRNGAAEVEAGRRCSVNT